MGLYSLLFICICHELYHELNELIITGQECRLINGQNITKEINKNKKLTHENTFLNEIWMAEFTPDN